MENRIRVCEKGRLTLDVRSKLIFLVLFNIIGFLVMEKWQEAICMGLVVVLIGLEGLYGLAMKGVAYYIIFSGIQMWLLNQNNRFFAMFSIAIIMFLKVMPMIFLAKMIFKTVKVGQLISALQKMKMPKEIIITLAATIRFFPMLKEEVGTLLEGLKLKGVTNVWLSMVVHPVSSFEKVIMPLMLRLNIVAEELSAAIITRGIEADNQRTSIYPCQISLYDKCAGVVIVGLFGVVMASRWI